MIKQLLKTLEKECSYHPKDLLLVGVSGGADSLALLHSLHSSGIPVVAAHYDHGLRDGSDSDCQFVEKFSLELSIPFVCKKGQVEEYAKRRKMSLEEAGRELRYQFLFEQAEEKLAGAVVVAHTADDQVETVLMHLLRGAGIDGLSGMAYSAMTLWNDRIPLLRPMLDIWRVDVDEYCYEVGLRPLVDQSNQDTAFYRNRIRHELLPVLEQYNPRIKTAILKTANTLHSDREFLEGSVNKYFLEVVEDEAANNSFVMRREMFLNHHKSIQRRLIRMGIQRLVPEIRDIGFDEVEKVIRYIMVPPRSGKADLFRWLRLWIGQENFKIYLADEPAIGEGVPQLASDQPILIEIPGLMMLSPGWDFQVERLSLDQTLRKEALHNLNLMTAYLDAESVGSALLVRPRSPGDLFCPLGMAGKKTKVSDFLINEKMPRNLRDKWPMVFADEELVWIPGYRIAHQARVKPDSKELVKITLIKIPD